MASATATATGAGCSEVSYFLSVKGRCPLRSLVTSVLGHFGLFLKSELTKDRIALTTSALGSDLSIICSYRNKLRHCNNDIFHRIPIHNTDSFRTELAKSVRSLGPK